MMLCYFIHDWHQFPLWFFLDFLCQNIDCFALVSVSFHLILSFNLLHFVYVLISLSILTLSRNPPASSDDQSRRGLSHSGWRLDECLSQRLHTENGQVHTVTCWISWEVVAAVITQSVHVCCLPGARAEWGSWHPLVMYHTCEELQWWAGPEPGYWHTALHRRGADAKLLRQLLWEPGYRGGGALQIKHSYPTGLMIKHWTQFTSIYLYTVFHYCHILKSNLRCLSCLLFFHSKFRNDMWN